MARTLDQIIAELSPTYDPQVNSLRQRQSLIPSQIAEEEKGLEAKQTNAFGDILSGARRRGLGFSGIPISEQAKYTSTEFLPALARLRQQGKEQTMSLEDAILGITERRNTLAQQLRQQEIDREEQQRQFNENLALQRAQMAAQERASRAAAASSFSPTMGGGGGGAAPTGPRAVQKGPGSWNFFDAAGRPITAGVYAKQTGMPVADVLRQLAASGDKGAAQAYNSIQAFNKYTKSSGVPVDIMKKYKHIFGGLY